MLYRYDGLGRRIEKRIRIIGGVTEVLRFIYDNEDIVLEYDKEDNITGSYLHGVGIDKPLSLTRHGNNYYYHRDGGNSVVLLTNDLGDPTQHYIYDTYGKISIYGATGLELSPSAAPVYNPYTYTGREYDQESGLYHYRARSYNPQSGRFLSEDQIGFLGRDENFYRYVINNPINHTDPTGTVLEDFVAERTTPEEQFLIGVGLGGFSAIALRAAIKAASNPATLPSALVLTTASVLAFYEGLLQSARAIQRLDLFGRFSKIDFEFALLERNLANTRKRFQCLFPSN